MNDEMVSLKVEFTNSHEKRLVLLSSLLNALEHFLEHYGVIGILGTHFCSIIGKGDGKKKTQRLLAATGYEGDPAVFFRVLIEQLEAADSREYRSIKINGITLPYLLLTTVLEILIPGNRFIQIRNVHQLEKLTNTRFNDQERKDLQQVVELFPVRLSMHVIRQMRVSRAIAYQYMPFVDELNPDGSVHTWVGQFHRGIVEQMYCNRIIFILNMSCPVYCRFCFRKHKECRNQKAPTQDHVRNALLYVRNSPQINEIVLTGGDPFMNRATLSYAIDGLKEIPHVRALRVATRSIAYYPHLFHANNEFWLNFLKRKYLELEARGKRLEVATHFIHPDEVSIESLDIITELTRNGITVYVQTPLLNDCNDSGYELKVLYEKLRGAGAEMHYIYIPCSPIKGNRRFVSPISRGMSVAGYLRANLSDRAMPRICTATKIGKIDWNLSGWAVEKDPEDGRLIWIRTPYTMEYFSTFAPILQLENVARVNPEGTLDVKFMAEIGDAGLFRGSREPRSTHAVFPPERELSGENADAAKAALAQLQAGAVADQRFMHTVVPTGSSSLFRTHRTRVEWALDAGNRGVKENIDYIRKNKDITDVVISGRDDVISSFFYLRELVRRLTQIDHVVAIRCRSHQFNYRPEIYTPTVLNQLAKLNNPGIVHPKRVEIETQFLHSSEFRPEHANLAANLRRRGITVYNNTPLLPFVNDSEAELLKMVSLCRQSGIEFHHLYIAGLPIQLPWSEEYPVDVSSLIDIASTIRRQESGRSIPRFVIRSRFGEVDFGLTSDVIESDEQGRVFVKLLPYDLAYFQRMDPGFSWPEDVRVDADGHPMVCIPGLKRTPEFLFS
ncbi:MAG: radical SAM protein [Candidatus Aminicenantes bacterium]|nr:radical SAM protein [Candidatus Aminicenantes bacterium]